MKIKLPNGISDSTVDQEIFVVFEKIDSGHQLKNTSYNEFAIRRQEYSCCKSLTFISYFPFIVVNKTNLDLKLYHKDEPLRSIYYQKSTYLNPPAK